MSNRRRESRNDCFLRADIIINKDTPPIVAEAHDISNSGVRIVTPHARSIPNEFILSIPRRRIREYVKVMRRKDNELGVIVINSSGIIGG
jgi:hypothetical protein